MKISSTSRRAMRSVIGPKSVIERSTRSTMTDGSTSGSSSPSIARRVVLVDRAVHLDPHLVEVAVGTELASLDPRQHVAPDPVVRVDGHARLRPPGAARPRRTGAASAASDRGRAATPARTGRTSCAVPRRRFDAAVGRDEREARGRERALDLGRGARRAGTDRSAPDSTRGARRAGRRPRDIGDPSEQAGDTDRVRGHRPRRPRRRSPARASSVDDDRGLDHHLRRSHDGRSHDVEHVARPDLRDRGQAREPADTSSERGAGPAQRDDRVVERRRGRARPRRWRCGGWARARGRAAGRPPRGSSASTSTTAAPRAASATASPSATSLTPLPRRARMTTSGPSAGSRSSSAPRGSREPFGAAGRAGVEHPTTATNSAIAASEAIVPSTPSASRWSRPAVRRDRTRRARRRPAGAPRRRSAREAGQRWLTTSVSYSSSSASAGSSTI